jgi:hypothetical protein
MAKQLTKLQAAEILAGLIEPKPEPGGQATMISSDQVWHWWPLVDGRWGDWQPHNFDPLHDMNTAIRCVEAAGRHWSRMWVSHPDGVYTSMAAVNDCKVHYHDNNHARALCLALLHALCGEAVEVTR